MTKKYQIINDPENVYQNGAILTANELISDYIDTLNNIEDADLIGWLYSLMEVGKQEIAVDFIKKEWDINLQTV